MIDENLCRAELSPADWATWEVAEMLGVSLDTYRNWEIGHTNPQPVGWPVIIHLLGYDPNPPASSFGERLRAKRRLLGWSQRRLAEHLGLDETTVLRYEQERKCPDQARMSKIERFLAS